MIDDITGLPLLSSDIYQIPLNTDAIPYNDLQAETRLPRQPMLPDDIIPTIALTTGLRSDGTGEVVHTDDHHAQLVYVVNQIASSGGGGAVITPNKYSGPSEQGTFGGTVGDLMCDASTSGLSRLCVIHVSAILDRDASGADHTAGEAFVMPFLGVESGTPHYWNLGSIPLYYSSAHPGGALIVGQLRIEWPAGLLLTDLGFGSSDLIGLYFSVQTDYTLKLSGYAAWYDA